MFIVFRSVVISRDSYIRFDWLVMKLIGPLIYPTPSLAQTLSSHVAAH